MTATAIHRITASRPGLRAPLWLRELVRRPNGAIGLAVVALFVAVALIAVVWTPHDPVQAAPYQQWLPASWQHPFGTDALGRDTLSRLMAATSTALVVAFAAIALSGVLGILLAALSSLTSVWFREATAVLIDVLVAFPTLLIAMMLASSFGGSLAVVILAVGISFSISIGRVTKAEMTRVLASDYVLAGRAAGFGPARTLVEHVVPNVGSVFIVQLSIAGGVAVLAEAGLSYLGYGAPPNTPSWGRMLADSQSSITTHPWSVIWPGLTIALFVFGLSLLGDAIREATDPRLKRGRIPASDEQTAAEVTW
ncbi:ABC transporter permease [Plantibacter sp. YIM 135249]|jgi:peptide/nickel transport system permease protein|uniref:ABC transporter permease n=1 Tax=Plantibacter sp. YIM 135249 TaxID=3423918 RepID=UPI003D344630